MDNELDDDFFYMLNNDQFDHDTPKKRKMFDIDEHAQDDEDNFRSPFDLQMMRSNSLA